LFAPRDHLENGNRIPDWALQWILCAADYWNLTANWATIDIIWPSIQKAMAWFARLCGPNGLVVDMPYWHFMDWAGVGRQREAAALNAQYAGALRAASVRAGVVGFGRAATAYRVTADGIIDALEARHWDERRGACVDMVDPVSGL
jgi:alpha-L-rhamnosidase